MQKQALQSKRKAGKLPPRGATQAGKGSSDNGEDEEDDGDESNDEFDEGHPLIDDIAEEEDSIDGDTDDKESEEDSEDDDENITTEGVRLMTMCAPRRGNERLITPLQVFLGAFDDSESSSDSDIEMEKKMERPKSKQVVPQNGKAVKQKAPSARAARQAAEERDDSEEDEEDEDVAWSDIDEPDEDLIPHQKLVINNATALLASLQRFRMPTDASVPFVTHQSIVGRTPTADAIPDVQDDLTRELQFYAQSLEAARQARALLLKAGVPFSRPTDYFAEMVKDDPHMDRVKERLVADATAKKAASDARKQRDLKKFGKQVQVAKLQERQKAKKDTLDKIKTLKRSAFPLPTLSALVLAASTSHLTSANKNFPFPRAPRVLGRAPDARG